MEESLKRERESLARLRRGRVRREFGERVSVERTSTLSCGGSVAATGGDL